MSVNNDEEASRPEKQETDNQAPLTDVSNDVEPTAAPEKPKVDEPTYPTGWGSVAITTGLVCAVVCVGLDRSIVGIAIPKITDEFHSIEDVGWYGSAYLVTMACLQLFFGKLYAEFSTKWVFLSALLIFEVGSIVCAAAPSSVALILGRAVAGVGGAGLISGALIIISRTVPLHARPRYTGAFGGAMGVAQVIAPTLGGVFTDKVTWRWCFWINLPFGGVTFLVVLFLVSLPAPPKAATESKSRVKDFLDKFDVKGTLILMPWVVCLLLALEWGGVMYAWNSWRIILLFVLFAVLLVVWIYIEYRQGDKATIPMRIIKQRSMLSGLGFVFCLFSNMYNIIYYVPLWFQAIKGISAYHSGIDMLAMSAPMSVVMIGAGFLTSKIGYYVPQMYFSVVISSVGCGLLYTFSRETSMAVWVIGLMLCGIGLGSGGQQPLMAVQTVFKGTDISLATSAMLFAQTMAGAVFLAISQTVFQNQLVSEARKLVPTVNTEVILKTGASDLREVMGRKYPAQLDGILEAYNKALQKVFLICVVLACVAIFGALSMEWISVNRDKKKKTTDDDKGPADAASAKVLVDDATEPKEE